MTDIAATRRSHDNCRHILGHAKNIYHQVIILYELVLISLAGFSAIYMCGV